MKAAKANERPKTLSTVATRKRRTMLSRLRDIVFISEKLYLNCLDPFSFSFLNAKKGGASFSFSFLDERKGGKRKSRHQGCLPSLPDTLKETKRGRGDCPGTSNETERLVPSCRRQSCARKKYPANCSTLDLGLFLDAKNGIISFSFSFLDERKGGKRKSRHRGCLPS